jgi:hypothetical protein
MTDAPGGEWPGAILTGKNFFMANKFMEDIVQKKDAPYSFVIENTWMKYVSFDRGWGNGYVAIPEGHPWFGKDYDSIEQVEINGGLTFSDMINGMWVIGFDTAHYGDTMTRWPKEAVEQEANDLLLQVCDNY